MSEKAMTGVIDYGAGNLGSVMNALARLSIPARFVQGPEELNPRLFRGIILPGDGHFATAAESLGGSGYAEAIKDWIKADRPFLGICLGLQLLFEKSEEAPPKDGKETPGFALIRGEVKKFPGRKVPQIGWNQTRIKKNSRLFAGFTGTEFFYYIHSYYVEPLDTADIAAEADYYLSYCSAVERGALAAVQFHPEKSGAAGLKLLENWSRFC
ncbi:MAG: imidazole glycerol phosphate synthase subunit HisH [Spirochaetaceae bacterium]|jgi:imidazole glycerol phosphate synthase glutamine amidotransferase subunit|nr:imidazole glycerol phosphate synthase subunit HisH [Spirochaetaceae bacterium]